MRSLAGWLRSRINQGRETAGENVARAIFMLQLNEALGPYVNNFAKESTWGALLLLMMVINHRSKHLRV
jgi:hypothetical protein